MPANRLRLKACFRAAMLFFFALFVLQLHCSEQVSHHGSVGHRRRACTLPNRGLRIRFYSAHHQRHDWPRRNDVFLDIRQRIRGVGNPEELPELGIWSAGSARRSAAVFYTFTLLHKLGDTQIESGEGPVLATKRKDGSLAILVWNLIPRPPGQKSSTGDPITQNAVQNEPEGEALNLNLARIRGGSSSWPSAYYAGR